MGRTVSNYETGAKEIRLNLIATVLYNKRGHFSNKAFLVRAKFKAIKHNTAEHLAHEEKTARLSMQRRSRGSILVNQSGSGHDGGGRR